MSILVDGAHTCSVSVSSSTPVTVLSSGFIRSRFTTRLFAFTINGGPLGAFTVALPCIVSHSLATDVCLGLDWVTGVREWYIGLGLNPSRDFDVSAILHAVVPTPSSSSSSSGTTARTAVPVPGPALGVTHTDVMQVISAKRADLMEGHGIANPLHAVFDRVEILPKAALISLATLHGVNIGSHVLPVARDILATHIASVTHA
ncbi:hypothetical protein B0H10DRAFT_2433448 [Mycena sp. CBHHK59/15]|nr:hypothetical protein B0H10DRAFT_2433448 [Mycena sp. CBHHK59/15]